MDGCNELYDRLAETREKIKDLEGSLKDILDDLRNVINAEANLISCLRLHAPDYFSQLEEASTEGLQLGGDVSLDVNVKPDDCARVRQLLVRASSLEASLTFQMAETSAVIRNEIIRLAGLVALCRHFEPELSESVGNDILYPLLSKYLSI
ncbi:MAG: hypothetical protein RXO27_03200 [Acidilobus sp.]|jgi:hypothetical protein